VLAQRLLALVVTLENEGAATQGLLPRPETQSVPGASGTQGKELVSAAPSQAPAGQHPSQPAPDVRAHVHLIPRQDAGAMSTEPPSTEPVAHLAGALTSIQGETHALRSAVAVLRGVAAELREAHADGAARLDRLVQVLCSSLPLPPDLAHGLLDSLTPQVPEVVPEEEEEEQGAGEDQAEAGSRKRGEEGVEKAPAPSASRRHHSSHTTIGGARKVQPHGKSIPGKSRDGHKTAAGSSEGEESSGAEESHLEDPLLKASLHSLQQVSDTKQLVLHLRSRLCFDRCLLTPRILHSALWHAVASAVIAEIDPSYCARLPACSSSLGSWERLRQEPCRLGGRRPQGP
jgi:hypothetical protein